MVESAGATLVTAAAVGQDSRPMSRATTLVAATVAPSAVVGAGSGGGAGDGGSGRSLRTAEGRTRWRGRERRRRRGGSGAGRVVETRMIVREDASDGEVTGHICGSLICVHICCYKIRAF